MSAYLALSARIIKELQELERVVERCEDICFATCDLSLRPQKRT